MREYGALLGPATVRFERTLPHVIEEVWEHITASEWLAGWLAPGVIEPRLGGKVTLHMKSASGRDAVTMHGEVTAWEPPSRLAYSWRESSTTSQVSFHLEAVPDGTRLTLLHESIPRREVLGFSHGWHACLDALTAALGRADEVTIRAAWLGDEIDKSHYEAQLRAIRLSNSGGVPHANPS